MATAELASFIAQNPQLIQSAAPVAESGIKWGAILIGIIIFLVIAGIIVLFLVKKKKKSRKNQEKSGKSRKTTPSNTR